MSSISYLFGLTAYIIRMSHTFNSLFNYYRTMKRSVLSVFEIDDKLLSQKNEIYKIILYYLMGFLYFTELKIEQNFFFISSISNLICFISILNMYLFITKNKNQMLLQTLSVFIIYQIINKFFHVYIINIFFICSGLLILTKTINQLRKGIIYNDAKYFKVDKLIVEITIGSFWLFYSLYYTVACFIIILLISLFVRICAILGFGIVIGKIEKNTKTYFFLVNFFFIKNNLIEKTESNIL